jgi:hypothetical protein
MASRVGYFHVDRSTRTADKINVLASFEYVIRSNGCSPFDAWLQSDKFAFRLYRDYCSDMVYPRGTRTQKCKHPFTDIGFDGRIPSTYLHLTTARYLLYIAVSTCINPAIVLHGQSRDTLHVHVSLYT